MLAVLGAHPSPSESCLKLQISKPRAGWHVVEVKNGNTDYESLRKAIAEAKSVKDKPTLIKVSFVTDNACTCR